MSEQMFTVAEAAAACGKSKETVTWRLKKKDFPGAKKVGRKWTIPLADLLAVGWQPTDSNEDQLQLERAQTELVEAYKRIANTASKQIESPLGFLKRALLG